MDGAGAEPWAAGSDPALGQQTCPMGQLGSIRLAQLLRSLWNQVVLYVKVGFSFFLETF